LFEKEITSGARAEATLLACCFFIGEQGPEGRGIGICLTPQRLNEVVRFFLLSVLAAPVLESRRGWRDLFLLVFAAWDRRDGPAILLRV
jgi:hypothetical protein